MPGKSARIHVETRGGGGAGITTSSTGIFTSRSVIFANSSGQLAEDPVLLFDSTQKALSVGTSLFPAALNIRQSTATLPILSLESSAGTQLIFVTSLGRMGIGTTAPTIFQVSEGTTVLFSVTTASVGIGTTAPTAALDVIGGAKFGSSAVFITSVGLTGLGSTNPLTRLTIFPSTAPTLSAGISVSNLIIDGSVGTTISTATSNAAGQMIFGPIINTTIAATIADTESLYIQGFTTGLNVTYTRRQALLVDPQANGSTAVRGIVVRVSTAANDPFTLESSAAVTNARLLAGGNWLVTTGTTALSGLGFLGVSNAGLRMDGTSGKWVLQSLGQPVITIETTGTTRRIGFFTTVAVAQPTSYTTDAYTTLRSFPTTLPPTLSTNSTSGAGVIGFPTDAAFVNQVNRVNALTSRVATLTGLLGTIYKDLVAYGLLK